jgi:hypothetical protein
MSDDLTARLREASRLAGLRGDDSSELCDAADRIEELEAEVERLRTGFLGVLHHGTGKPPRQFTCMSSPKAIAEFMLMEDGAS